ncbi:NUDIX domain-containing protein [Schleiferilactobacillus perolens]|uniref:NUDIX domain-containing protein n=1 Tax=Schleiferilactobacillus perolens TaxID=100468 RepID=UPI0023558BDD|nr:NUDIX domain-containing protein [Schleiferilactobacillus perolens]MCI2170437.1 NUDIX domain-containing protein [Schleiferilactobacillus perolens]
MPTRGAFGVILNDTGQVLLVRRRDFPLWDLPGGTLQENELPEIGVRREVREETGLNVTIDHLVGTYFRLLHEDEQSIFVVTIQGGQMVRSGPETKELAYFAPTALPKNMVALRPQQIADALAGKHDLHPIIEENRWAFRAEKILRKLQRNRH